MISSKSKTKNKRHLSSSSSSFKIFCINISNMNAGNMLQNRIHLQNIEPKEIIPCILIVLLLVDDRSKRIKLRTEQLVHH